MPSISPGTAFFLTAVLSQMAEENRAELRAKIAYYRQMMRQVDDPGLREALEEN